MIDANLTTGLFGEITLPSLPVCFGDAVSRTVYEVSRLRDLTEWWHWVLLTAVCSAVVVYIGWMYRRDGTELPRGLTVVLAILRVAAFLGILVFFFGIEKKTIRELVRNSRVILLVDTSQSMGLTDGAKSGSRNQNRVGLVAEEFAVGGMLDALRDDHDVVVARFDQGARPSEIASLPKFETVEVEEVDGTAVAAEAAAALVESQVLWSIAASLALLALISAVIYFATVNRAASLNTERTAWSMLVAVVLLIGAVVTAAVANLRHPEITLAAVFGQEPPASAKPPSPVNSRPEDESTSPEEPVVDWRQQLRPRGLETRLGDNLVDVINRERGGPIAGIAVFTDGNNNAGGDPLEAVQMADDAGLPLYAVGMGSDERPVNVRVVDVEAPRRVYPDDDFNVTGFVQSAGLSGRSLRVELVMAPTPDEVAGGTVLEERTIQLPSDNKIAPVEFLVDPKEEGRRVYAIRVVPPDEDSDAQDNVRSAPVEVVARKNRVLLMAGGPTREFRFLRNLLYRDEKTTVDVYLQTATEGVSQEADEILLEFPGSEAELFEKYDCIVAFDPDWLALDLEQVNLLDRWVAEKAGGLIVIAGPVYTPNWAGLRRGDPRVNVVKRLYPVQFYSRGTSLGLGRFGSETASPLQFSREGLAADYLWLADSPTESEAIWTSFEGVYGYYAVKGIKAGATIYSRFADTAASIEGDMPIYFAGHFYGAGRVFYMASGELWRIRALEPDYFERFYTQLIRYVSQGRLLRDSSRGLLLTNKERCLMGETIIVRAQLTDAQYRPLEVPEVQASLVTPGFDRESLTLRKVVDSPRAGLYSGQFPALSEGDYRIELPLSGADSDEVLTREVRVRVPDLEIENPQRNDQLLKEITEKTGGSYYIGIDAAAGRTGAAPLAGAIEPQELATSLPDTPDQKFQQRLRLWLLGWICGALGLEWLLRRMSKLA